jgi:hypothetical protein
MTSLDWLSFSHSIYFMPPRTGRFVLKQTSNILKLLGQFYKFSAATADVFWEQATYINSGCRRLLLFY